MFRVKGISGSVLGLLGFLGCLGFEAFGLFESD